MTRAALMMSRLCAGVFFLVFLLTGCAQSAPAATPVPPQPTATAAPTRPAPVATATPAPSPRPTAEPTRPAPPATATPAPTATPDACLPLPLTSGRPRYRFAVEADPQAHTLQVKQQVAVADPVRLATGELVFNVPANGVPGVFTLTRARLAAQAQAPLATLAGTALHLRLPAAAANAPAVTACLDYTLRLPPAGGEGISAAHALGWSELGMIAGYWYPALAPHAPTTAAGWRLTPYHPVGDPVVYETADYEAAIRVPAPHQVIAAGLRGMQEGVWRLALARARGFAFSISNRLIASQTEAAGIPVRVYHLSEHAAGAQAALRAVREALPLFAQTYGPYPYAELVIIEAAQFGGMEYSALITFSRDWFADYRPPAAGADFGADLLVRFVVHELGHQWWYGAVGNDQAHEPWLDEALARYGEVVYYETLHPTHLAWWEAPSQGMATQPINQPIYRFADTPAYVRAVYVSGTRFLLDVRKLLGQPAFTALLQEYRRRYEDRIVTEAELLALLRERLGPALDKLLRVYFQGLN
jgi:hypothetical protein